MAKVLIACEYSGIVRNAFSKLGHDAWSIDIIPTESEGNHIIGDAMDHLDDGWDLMIAHPPCTFLSVTGTWCLYHPEDRHLPTSERRANPKFPNRRQQQNDALDFVQKLMDAPIPKICIENPVSVISSRIRKPDQYVQPFHHGHKESKKTGLWLKNLPLLEETDNVWEETKDLPDKLKKRIWWMGGANKKLRSKFYTGIADAMANQWGKLLEGSR